MFHTIAAPTETRAASAEEEEEAEAVTTADAAPSAAAVPPLAAAHLMVAAVEKGVVACTEVTEEEEEEEEGEEEGVASSPASPLIMGTARWETDAAFLTVALHLPTSNSSLAMLSRLETALTATDVAFPTTEPLLQIPLS